ncbi:MAG: lamin tail domain-containing protein [Candidatus Doudnabacteria bacterium]|nr:lamin tail domain-containing protein [Candidatus Doudnabacteria bacterium]
MSVFNYYALFSVSVTNAFFGDAETSDTNGFTAGSLDFSLDSEADFDPEVTPTEDATRTVTVENDGSLGFQYRAQAVNLSGDLCGSLDLTAELDTVEQYSEALSGFNMLPFVFEDPEEWDFTVSLNSSDESLQNETCNFDFQFDGWQEELAEGVGGFTDQEIINNTVTAGEWETECTDPTVEITTVETGSSFDYGDADVVIKSGGALQNTGGGNLAVSTNCDLTVEDGGEILTDETTNAGSITLTVGGNLSIAGSSVSASSGSNSSTNNGGDITINVTGDFTLTGTVTSFGQENAGDISVTVGDTFSISSTGQLFSKSGDSSSTNNGGDITINVSGDFTVSGEVNSYGSENAGDITLDLGEDFSIPSGGKVYSKAGSTSSTNTGGDITGTIDGNLSVAGELASSGDEQAGDIDLTVSGTTSVAGTSIQAKSGDTSSTNTGGLIAITSTGNFAVSGLIDAYGQEQGGDIELITQGIFTLTSSGTIQAKGGSSSSANKGGNISIIARGGNSSFAGNVFAGADETGGNIAITVAGNLSISEDQDVNAGTTSSTNTGGTIVYTTSGLLTVSSGIEATGPEGDGSIQTNYCTKDFTGATFDPAALEITNCDTVVLNEYLPNPSGSDDAAMPGGEWVELYNYGSSNVSVAGWVLYDSDDGNELAITTGNTDTGGTTVAAGGYLVVYRNGDGDFELNNSGGDSVRVYDGEIGSGGTLRDSNVYTSAAGVDKSFARIPDGGVWVDPVPTPGKPNKRTRVIVADEPVAEEEPQEVSQPEEITQQPVASEPELSETPPVEEIVEETDNSEQITDNNSTESAPVENEETSQTDETEELLPEEVSEEPSDTDNSEQITDNNPAEQEPAIETEIPDETLVEESPTEIIAPADEPAAVTSEPSLEEGASNE